MTSASALTTRVVEPKDFPTARRLVAAAFSGEPFARGMFGDSALARFAGLAADYEDWPAARDPLVIGASCGGHLVGVAVATLPGRCGLCDVFEPSSADGLTNAARIEREFQLSCRRVHLANDLPPHAHITTVATEPALHGSGIGRVVMAAVSDHLRARAVEWAVLECIGSRAPFYEHCGFERLEEFVRSWRPGAAGRAHAR